MEQVLEAGSPWGPGRVSFVSQWREGVYEDVDPEQG